LTEYRIIILICTGLFCLSCNHESSEERESREYCETKEKETAQIQSLIISAKACSVDSDCEIVGFGCPFGCETGINKANSSRVNEEVDNYFKNTQCVCINAMLQAL